MLILRSVKLLLILGFLQIVALASAQRTLPGEGPWGMEFGMEAGSSIHFLVPVRDFDGEIVASMEHEGGEADLYLRRNRRPSTTQYDFRPFLINQPETARIANNTSPEIENGVVWVSVFARRNTGVTLNILRRRTVSSRSGMGGTPYTAGTSFRVWAPNASQVSVSGQFNSWSSTTGAMTSEGNGNWSIDYRNARAGQEYKYVIRNGNQTLWRNDPRARQLTNSVGNSIIFSPIFNWTSSGFATPTWDKSVVYQLHIGAFNDSDGGRPGTFDTAYEKLDYLAELGVNTILLLPVNEFAGDFSWGYNPSYPFSVESAYGGPAKLKRFVDEAHKRGLAVMLDVVYNHFGPSDLDLWRFDGWSQNNRGGIYFYNDNRAITPWGDTRPDFGRGEVRQYLRDNALQWLEEFRLDGLRFDSTLNIRRTNNGDNGDGWSLMQWLNNEVDARQPWKLMLAEDLQGESYITRPTSAGGAGFDTQWSAQFVHPIRAAIEAPFDSNRNMWSVRDAIIENANGGGLKRMIYTESHDEVANGRRRVPSEIDSANPASYFARKRSTLGASLVFTSPGIPMIFMGQEFLEQGFFQDSVPLDFTKSVTFSGIRQMYKDLIALRKNVSGQTAGLTGNNVNVFHVNNASKVIAFHRWKNGGVGDDVVVISNFSNTSFNQYNLGLPAGGSWSVVFNSDWQGYGSDFSNLFNPDFLASGSGLHGFGFSGSVKIAPYSTLILVRK